MSATASGRMQNLLDDYVESFLRHLRGAGYENGSFSAWGS